MLVAHTRVAKCKINHKALRESWAAILAFASNGIGEFSHKFCHL